MYRIQLYALASAPQSKEERKSGKAQTLGSRAKYTTHREFTDREVDGSVFPKRLARHQSSALYNTLLEAQSTSKRYLWAIISLKNIDYFKMTTPDETHFVHTLDQENTCSFKKSRLWAMIDEISSRPHSITLNIPGESHRSLADWRCGWLQTKTLLFLPVCSSTTTAHATNRRRRSHHRSKLNIPDRFLKAKWTFH